MHTIKQISLNVDEQSQYVYVSAMQGDNLTRYIDVQLIDGIDIYIIPEDVSAKASGVKPDKSAILNDCDIINNQIRIQLTEQMLAKEGTFPITVTLFRTNTEERITGTEFTLIVNKTPLANLKLESFSESTALLRLLSKLEKVEQAMTYCQTTANECVRIYTAINNAWTQMKTNLESKILEYDQIKDQIVEKSNEFNTIQTSFSQMKIEFEEMKLEFEEMKQNPTK